MRSFKSLQPSSGRNPYSSRSDDQTNMPVTTRGIELEVQVKIDRDRTLDDRVKWDMEEVDLKSDLENQKIVGLTKSN